MEQESMIFYRSFYEALRDLDDDIRLELYDAIMRYSLYEEEVELSAGAKPFFRLISPQLDANLRRRKNGSLGGRPAKESKGKKTIGSKNNNHRFTETKTIGYENKKTTGYANEKPNVNVNENVNVNINKKKFNDYPESKTDYSSLNIFAN